MRREIFFMKAYQFKAGSSQREDEWKNIASDLCEAMEVTFQGSIAAVIRKTKKKMRAQVNFSWSTTHRRNRIRPVTTNNPIEESLDASENYEKDTKEKQDPRME